MFGGEVGVFGGGGSFPPAPPRPLDRTLLLPVCSGNSNFMHSPLRSLLHVSLLTLVLGPSIQYSPDPGETSHQQYRNVYNQSNTGNKAESSKIVVSNGKDFVW